jgi:hypothetical protein
MVKIIKGTYGHYDGRKVIPINEKSGPQSFDPEVEARLVKKGVAVYVGDAPAAGNDAGDGMPAYNADMKLDDLKKIAEAYGVDASKAKSKKAVIDMIEAAKAAQDDADDDNGDDDGVVDDDETPPAVGAAMPE